MSDTKAVNAYDSTGGKPGRRKPGPRVLVVTRWGAVTYRGRQIKFSQEWVGKRVVVTETKTDHVVVRDPATGAVIRELDLGPSGTSHGLRRTSALQIKTGLRFVTTNGAVQYRGRAIGLGVAWVGKYVVVSEPEPDHVVVRDHATGAVIRELDLGPFGIYHGLRRRLRTPPPAPHAGSRTVLTSGAVSYCGRTIYLGTDWVGKLVTVTEPEPDHAVVRDHATGAVIRELSLGPIGTYHGSVKPAGAQRKTGPRVVSRAGAISYGQRAIGFGQALAGKLVIVTEPKLDHVVVYDPATGEVLRTVDLGPVGTYHGTGVRGGGNKGYHKAGPRVLVVTRSGAAVTYKRRNIGLGVAWVGKRVIVNEPVPGRVVITDHLTGAVLRTVDLGPVGTYHGTGGKPGGRRKAVHR